MNMKSDAIKKDCLRSQDNFRWGEIIGVFSDGSIEGTQGLNHEGKQGVNFIF